MNIECIAIGDELLDGRIVDTNSHWLGAFLADRGANLQKTSVVPDQLETIVFALQHTQANLVIVCGGLGPTADDLTRDAAAQWLGVELREDPIAKSRMEERFAARNIPITPNNYRQALFPATATVLQTEVGSAAGFALNTPSKTLMFFPGVPREFRWFVETFVTPHLPDIPTARTRLYFHGRGESSLENDLEGIEPLAAKLGAKVGYRADFPVIEVKLSGPPSAVAQLRQFVLERASQFAIGEDDETLAARVGKKLLARGLSLTTAESCTGGGIASAITDIPGSSNYFQRAWVTYANQAKIDELDVHPDTLTAFGAVSPQTVCQMALGAQTKAHADLAIAVSGIAGPGGGSPEKPVGTVDLALATPEGVYYRRIHVALQQRHFVRLATVYSALAMVNAWLDDEPHRFKVHGPFSHDDVRTPQGISIPVIP